MCIVCYSWLERFAFQGHSLQRKQVNIRHIYEYQIDFSQQFSVVYKYSRYLYICSSACTRILHMRYEFCFIINQRLHLLKGKGRAPTQHFATILRRQAEGKLTHMYRITITRVAQNQVRWRAVVEDPFLPMKRQDLIKSCNCKSSYTRCLYRQIVLTLALRVCFLFCMSSQRQLRTCFPRCAKSTFRLLACWRLSILRT